MAHPITQLELEMSRELDNRTEADTQRRAQFRMHTLIAAWYDDEPSEPDQAIRDVLTDLVHLADERGIDIHAALDRACGWPTRNAPSGGWGRCSDEQLAPSPTSPSSRPRPT
jgi:hypothetical protein